MKKLLLLLTFFLLKLTCFAQTSEVGIHFENLNYEQAIAKAKAENKIVFLAGFATWCHFCEYMKDSVYPQKEVGDFFNKNFINIHLDMEKEGKDINRRLQASSYPQLVFFNGNGEIVHRVAGQKSVSTFIATGQDALNPDKRFRTYELKYLSGKASPDDVSAYFRMVNSAAIEGQGIFSEYLMNLPDSVFLTRSTFLILNEFFRDVEQPAMKRFLAHRKEFNKISSTDSVDNRIINNFNSSFMMYVQRLDTVHYNRLATQLQASGLDLSNKILAYVSLNKHKMKSEYDAYQQEAVPFIETYCKDDYRRLSELAYNIYDKGTDPAILAKAEVWAKEAVKQQENYKNYHTLACVSFKLGKKDEAMNAANKALEYAKKMNVDPKQTNLLIDKIKEAK